MTKPRGKVIRDWQSQLYDVWADAYALSALLEDVAERVSDDAIEAASRVADQLAGSLQSLAGDVDPANLPGARRGAAS